MRDRALVTGGAGFVGSSLALLLKSRGLAREVVALDNLRRKGSELARERLTAGGVHFLAGDVRYPEDLAQAGEIDLLVDCAAEPSALAGYDDDPRYLLDTNLVGTLNCLEHVRRHGAAMILLSTSRVYPIEALRALPLERCGDRLSLPDDAIGPGFSSHGIDTDFSIEGPRSLYGTTKLCSELLVQEYAAMYDLDLWVNRCGVIAGPWQMGRVDQGFVALWAARALYGGTLEYIGFGGEGLQVRDVLHVDDLGDLIALQLADVGAHRARVYGVGGGLSSSVSLRELTDLCNRLTGGALAPGSRDDTHPADVPWFVTDPRPVSAQLGWKPVRSMEQILEDTLSWLGEERARLEPYFRV